MQAENTPYGYCKCGCGQKTSIARKNRPSRGWIKGEPVGWVHASHKSRRPPKPPRPPRTPLREFEVNAITGCWIWLKAKDAHGYGIYTAVGQASQLAHRMMWEQQHGPVPEGLELDHLCQNPTCVNPAHLEPVSHTVNMRRARHVKLTLDEVRAIRERSERGADALSLAIEYGVSRTHIYRIRKHAIWRDS